MKSELINTSPLLKAFLDGLKDIEGEPPSLYVDLEGNNLSRLGTLSLVTVLVGPGEKVYLIDVTTLGRDAFDVAGSDGRSLRSILESSEIIKVFFDIRNDSDALYSLYGVHVRGIWDLQLMELASRNFQKRCVNGLAKCIERDSRIGYEEKAKWRRVKEKGRDLFDPSRGGSYAVFDQRPLSSEMEDYCTQDVAFMPHLCEIYHEKLCDAWWGKIEIETDARIRLSQSPTFNGKGRHMAEAPRGWVSWRPSFVERGQRTLLTIPIRRNIPSGSEDLPRVDDVQESAPQSPADLSKLFEDMRLKAPDPSYDNDSDDELERRWVSYSRDHYDSDRDEARDYAACDSECGYCGKCPY
jgi:exonuclease 3'-5' domain-containing protein 1